MKDSAAVNLYETSNGLTLHYDVIDGRGFAEGLKITSQAQDITVFANKIIGGYEDCVDINNRCKNITVVANEWEPRGKYLATDKGGSENVKLKGKLLAHGTEVDVDGGNYSDQSHKTTEGISLELQAWDGSPVTYRSLDAKSWHLAGGPYICIFRLWGPFRKVFTYGYALLKFLHIL